MNGAWSPDTETCFTVRRHRIVDLHLADPRARGTLPDVSFEPLDRLGLAFRLDFHATVGQVAHPPVQPLVSRGRLGEKTKADALNPATDEISSRHAHGRARDYTCATVRPKPEATSDTVRPKPDNYLAPVTTTKRVGGARCRHNTRPDVTDIPSRS